MLEIKHILKCAINNSIAWHQKEITIGIFYLDSNFEIVCVFLILSVIVATHLHAEQLAI